VGTAAHAVALDTGQTRIFLAIDERHVGELAVESECGRRAWLVAEARSEEVRATEAQGR
jgi:hypothetical protein